LLESGSGLDQRGSEASATAWGRRTIATNRNFSGALRVGGGSALELEGRAHAGLDLEQRQRDPGAGRGQRAEPPAGAGPEDVALHVPVGVEAGAECGGGVLGLEADYRTLGKPNRDGYELFLTQLLDANLSGAVLALVRISFGEVDGKRCPGSMSLPAPSPCSPARSTANNTRSLGADRQQH
jgi:hypothetical protein